MGDFGMEDDGLGGLDLDALGDELAGAVDSSSILDWLNRLRIGDGDSKAVDTPPAAKMDLETIAKRILEDGCRVVTMSGAGLSTSAGIPDFRTPGTGLYDNLQELGLPTPQSVFSLDFYMDNPRPFCRLAKDIWPGNYNP